MRLQGMKANTKLLRNAIDEHDCAMMRDDARYYLRNAVWVMCGDALAPCTRMSERSWHKSRYELPTEEF